MNDEILTLKQAAEVFGCHPGTLYRMARAGIIPSFRIGIGGHGGWRFRKASLLEWIDKAIEKSTENR